MVFDDRGDDHVVGCEPEAVRQVVDGLGGVAADDGDVVAGGIAPGKGEHGGAGLLVGRSCGP